MLKIRVTYIDDEEGNRELQELQQKLQDELEILNKSKIYKGRGSKYSSIYFDVKRR